MLLKRLLKIHYKIINKADIFLKNFYIKKYNLIPDERSSSYSGRIFYCPCCEESHPFNPLPKFYNDKLLRYGHIHSTHVYETLNKDFYSCSNCGASDRDRLYAMYIKEILRNNEKIINMLDIAPSKSLTSFIKKFPKIKYKTADLYMEKVNDNIDITNMPYADESFDVIICSHVLEHIENDIKALKELYRILNKNGWGILMVPINLHLEKDYENPSAKTPEERWKHFGQNDHVRIYSKQGFIKKVLAANFKIQQLDSKHLGAEKFKNYGIANSSVLYVVTK